MLGLLCCVWCVVFVVVCVRCVRVYRRSPSLRQLSVRSVDLSAQILQRADVFLGSDQRCHLRPQRRFIVLFQERGLHVCLLADEEVTVALRELALKCLDEEVELTLHLALRVLPA